MAIRPDPPRRPTGTFDPSALATAFEEQLDLPPGERAAFLADWHARDPMLAEELHSLCKASDRLGRFLEPPAVRGPLEMPRELAGYRLERELGRGAHGIVWLAEQLQPRRKVALKLLRWDHVDPSAALRALREAELLARLDHPGCARVIESGLLERVGAPATPWIAMAFVDGQPLDRAVAGLDVDSVLRLFEALCAAVHAAHMAGLVHRDLKPDNVLVDRTGQPVVLDFGIARLLEVGDKAVPAAGVFRTQTGWLLGTPPYMAPEQARGDHARVDVRTDVYALGVLLYEALTGELPIDTRGAPLTEALRRIDTATPTPLRERAPHLPRDLQRVIDQALAHDPSRRYASARALAADLAAVRECRPVAARAPSLAYQWLRFVQRHRVLTSAMLTALVSLSAGLAASLVALERARSAEAATRSEQRMTQRLADLHLVGELERMDGLLWPATPDNEPELARWVAVAESLHARIAPDLARLAEAPDSLTRSELDALTRADEFFSPEHPRRGLPALRRRLDRARRVVGETTERHRMEWAAAAERVAADPRFAGWSLVPQVGLVPLGPDPASGLEEFAVWGWTGDIPLRSPTSRRLLLTEHTAVVFVLVPGGQVTIGAQSTQPDAPWYAADAQEHAHLDTLDLDPFLIAKYEFTQGQWLDLGLSSTSYWEPGDHVEGLRVDRGYCVESLNWNDALEAARRLGVSLPTEAQFEVALRGGADTDWWTVPTPQSMSAWSRDPAYGALAALFPESRVSPLLKDGVPRPVGSLPPNPFGLHEIYGGAIEWCLDTYWVHAGAPESDPDRIARRSGDGLAVHPDAMQERANRHRVLRGVGDWRAHPGCSAWFRGDAVDTSALQGITFRVARRLER